MGKLDDLRDKLNDSVQDLLAKTPFGKKGAKDEDDDTDADTGEFTSNDLRELNDKTEVTLATEIDDEDREIKKGIKKQLIIRVGLGLVIIGLVLDQFVFKSDNSGGNSPDDILANLPDAKSAKRKRRKRNKPETTTEQATGTSTTVEKEKNIPREQPESSAGTVVENAEGDNGSSGQNADTANNTNSEQPMPTDETANIGTVPPDGMESGMGEDSPLKLDPEENVVEKENTKVLDDATGVPPETPAEVLAENVNDKSPEATNKIEEMEELPDLETTLEQNSPSDNSKMGEAKNSDVQKKSDSMSANNQDEAEKSLDAKMMDTIKAAEKKEYVPPPNYDLIGRGLVYNCTDKHWSCVNKKAFFQCRDNFKWTKSNSKPAECAIKNVYANVKDCEKVQQYNIDNLITSDSCQK